MTSKLTIASFRNVRISVGVLGLSNQRGAYLIGVDVGARIDLDIVRTRTTTDLVQICHVDVTPSAPEKNLTPEIAECPNFDSI